MLKRIGLILFSAAIFTAATATAATLSFGPAFDKTQGIPVAQVLQNPASYVDQVITIEGQVQAVCKKMGCWMTLATTVDSPTFKIKVRDGDMVFPVSAMGKSALVRGKVAAMPMNLAASKEYLAHLAEEQGEPFDANSVVTPVTLYQLVPTSVEIAE